MATGASNFPEATTIYGGADCYNIAAYEDMQLFQGHMVKRVITKWDLTPDEIAEIMRTGCVYLSQMGGLSPTSIHGQSPFIP